MKVLKVIEKCKTLDENTLFECRLASGNQASRILFRLQEHFLGESKTVMERKLGRFLVSVYCEYKGCNGFYNAETKKFQFSRCLSHQATKTISTIEKLDAIIQAKKLRLAKGVSAEEFDIEKNILRKQVSSRGGGVEIKLDDLGLDYKGEKMSAYQNYLGGGMLGRVASNNTIERQGGNMARQNISEEMRDKLSNLEERLRKYYFELTNPSDDEWEHQSYEQNQQMSVSAY